MKWIWTVCTDTDWNQLQVVCSTVHFRVRTRRTAAVLMDGAGVFVDKLQKTWSKESEMVRDMHPILKRNLTEVDCSFSVTGSIFAPNSIAKGLQDVPSVCSVFLFEVQSAIAPRVNQHLHSRRALACWELWRNTACTWCNGNVQKSNIYIKKKGLIQLFQWIMAPVRHEPRSVNTKKAFDWLAVINPLTHTLPYVVWQHPIYSWDFLFFFLNVTVRMCVHCWE